MIEVTRFNGSLLYLNPDMVLFAEATPDTIITLTNGEKILVKETPQQLIDKFVNLKRRIATEGFPIHAAQNLGQ